MPSSTPRRPKPPPATATATATATPPATAKVPAASGKVTQRGDAGAQETPAPLPRPTGAWVEPYLEALARCGLKTVAYRAAGVNASTVMRHRDREPGFDKREEVAFRKALTNVVEPALMKRAIHGTKKVRYGRDGKILSIEHECSDQVALRLAERLETGSWRQKQQVEHSGSIGFKTRAERIAKLEELRKESGLTIGIDRRAGQIHGKN